MRKFMQFKIWLGVSILCGLIFLVVKLGYEWPQKFEHFGAFIKQDALAKYEPYLGNKYLKEKNLDPRVEVSGYLQGLEITVDPAKKEQLEAFLEAHELEIAPMANNPDLRMVKHKAGEDVIRLGVAEDLEEVKLIDGKMESVIGRENRGLRCRTGS